MYILGISAYYHDSAACLLENGAIVAASQEERFTRKKHDAGFPRLASRYCLSAAGIDTKQLDAVVFYDKPFLKFERLLETYLAFAPRGVKSFLASMPIWIKQKLFLKDLLRGEIKQISPALHCPPLYFTEHHQAHAASAFFPSPFERAAILCLDGVGEWATTSAWLGQENQLTPLWQINFPHSLGLLYSAFTYYTGFKVNSGEYKVMGLAPYGKPVYVNQIKEHLIDIKPDGSFRLNLNYFDYCTGLTMTNVKFHRLFEGPPRKPEAPLTDKEMNLASSIQAVTEEIILKLSRTLKAETGEKNLCLAGGVALNCVANGRLLKEKIFEHLWIQPGAGDAGGAIGSALAFWHQLKGEPRKFDGVHDSMQGACLGPKFSPEEISGFLEEQKIPYHRLSDQDLLDTASEALAQGKILGWFQGRMEFGPRALGNRSILADARNPQMQAELNLKIKFRESFRPFAPSVLKEEAGKYFDLEVENPYMLLTAPILPQRRIALTPEQEQLQGLELLNIPKSDIPAVTHIDYSARIQTVDKERSPRYHQLLEAFKRKTGFGVLINTSFNLRGEPIVMSPQDAYLCFMRTNLDLLALDNFLLYKNEQPPFKEQTDWRTAFELD